MRVVVQRVESAGVEAGGAQISRIGAGMLVLLGIKADDTARDLKFLVDKVSGLRIFEDETGKMNISVSEAGGEALVVSQFTLYGDVRRGLRPSFTEAAGPREAEAMYEGFIEGLRARGIRTAAGKFQAEMKVRLVNNGPVTIIIDSRKEI